MEKMCELLDVSQSGYYKWCQEKTNENNYQKRRYALLERITWLFLDADKRYGSPTITKLLRQEGWIVSERTVGKLMHENELRSRPAKAPPP
ncbi:transposase [Cohnella sp. LGH]|uniref:IS3 family transposase n=1 Tax=Cohnella sp. LGH TaxID=1619153 RepID=UPI001ADBDBE4|nr:IS3 family transposase [Cohnella sp. LGH]QTH42577.1 transposase [Cohnella sp. LGH]